MSFILLPGGTLYKKPEKKENEKCSCWVHWKILQKPRRQC